MSLLSHRPRRAGGRVAFVSGVRRLSPVAVLALGSLILVATPSAWAQAQDRTQTEAQTQTQRLPLASSRPRIEVAVGMGASIDDAGLSAAGLSAVPSFFAMGGFGEGVLGVDMGLFANSANGRFRAPNVPVDRLALDAMLVLRPGALWRPSDDRYVVRVVRTAAIDVGVGYERDSRIARAPESVDRLGTRVGAHIDVPLTPAAATRELRLRLAVRRFVGASQAIFPGGDVASNTRGEMFAALVSVF